MDNQVSFIPIGGIEDVTKNMYLYETNDEILIVDCGLGFPDETMPGVDLLIPDISYLKRVIQGQEPGKKAKRIVGMILTHGHEDHIGGIPFVLPHLPDFPIYGSTLTAALANDKLKDFGLQRSVQTVNFSDEIKLGSFTISFIRVTHSILDASNLFIKTPVGNFYHGSDFKFDFTPVDGKRTQIEKIAKAGEEGVLCLFSDSLGSIRPGHSPSEMDLYDSFEEEFRKTKGKIFVTTYSSNISRLNQAIEVGIKQGRKVCFLGRSLIKAKDIGRSLNYMSFPKNMEIRPHEVQRMNPSKVLILVAGAQAQEDSALVRIASEEYKDIKINKDDTVIFSADPIPGNEKSISSLIDTISKRGAKVVYSDITDEFHVSGHGYSSDLKLMISLTRPKYLVPMGGTYARMVGYREIAKSIGYKENNIFLVEDGREINFSQNGVRLGKKMELSTIFVDEVTRKKVDDYVVVDRLRISKEGIAIVVCEIESSTGQLVERPDLIARGFIYEKKDQFAAKLWTELNKIFKKKREKVTNWIYYRRLIANKAEDMFYAEGREPLVIPVVIEV